jgi:hypothetical protein
MTDASPPGITGKFIPWDLYTAFELDYDGMNENPIAGWPQKKNEYETFAAITNLNTHIATNTNEFGLSPITAIRPSLLPDPFAKYQVTEKTFAM